MFKKLLFLFIFLISISSQAQNSFVDGYYVTNSGQKITVQIKDEDWRNNPRSFIYLDGAENKTLTINDVQEFGFASGTKFVRHTVNIDRSSEKINEISTDKNPIFKEEQLFLKVLLEGEADLFEYLGETNLRYFYALNEAKPIQLVHKSYLSKVNGDITIVKNNYYLQQLWNDLKCESVKRSEIENINYTRADLSRFFSKYNDCKNSTTTVFKREKRDLFNLTPKIHVNSVKAGANNVLIPERNSDFDNKIGVSFGVEAEFILGFNNNKWSIFAEPTYQSYTNEVTTASTTTSGYEFTSVVEYASIELPVGARHYFFLNESSKIFVNAAYVFDFPMSSNFKFTRNDGTSLGAAKLDTSGSMAFGAGFKYDDKYSIEFRFNTKRHLLQNYMFWQSEFQVMSLIIGYSLF